MLTEGSDKETRHFEFSLEGSGLSYEPGDSLGVLPFNCSGVVDDLLTAVGFSGNEEVALVENKINLPLKHKHIKHTNISYNHNLLGGRMLTDGYSTKNMKIKII